MLALTRQSGIQLRRPGWPFAMNRKSNQSRNLAFWFAGGAPRSALDMSTGRRLATPVAVPVARPVSQLGGGGWTFNGTSQYYSFPLALTATTGWTLTCWVRPQSIAQVGLFLLNGLGTDGYGIGIGNGGGSSGAKLEGLLGNITWIDPGFTFPAAGRNYFVAMTNDGTTTALYANSGVPLATTSAAGPIAPTSTTFVGANGSSGDNFFSGQVIDARMYVGPLSGSVLQSMYNPATRWDLYAKPRRSVWITSASGILFDAASNSGYQAAASTYNWNHTCTGANRFLAVDISLLSAGSTVTGITYNGVAMSLIGAQSTVTSFGRVECWGLVAPASGTNSIAVTLSGSIASAGTAVSYTGVNQTFATEAFNSAQAANVGAADATVTITTVADNDWVHAAIATSDAAITAGQTTRNNVTGAGGSAADEDTGPKTPAGAQAMTYTDVGALATWAIAGYAIRPVAASNASSWFDLTIVPTWNRVIDWILPY